MTPTYCPFHNHWTDGACQSGKRSLDRNDLALRIGDIDAQLGDTETAQSNGFHVNQALSVERAHLQALRDVLP